MSTRRGRLTLFFLLYVAEGLPLGLSIYALSAYFRSNGVPVADIGLFMAGLVAPWTFKWAWAPLVDLIRIQRFGPNRTWIVVTQAMMAFTLAFLFFLDPNEDFWSIAYLLILHNVFAATQDVAIDGFAARILPEDELTWANGLMFAGQNFGMALGGGGSLYVASLYGFQASFALVLGILVCIVLTVSLRIQDGNEDLAPKATDRSSFAAALASRLAQFGRELYIGFFRSGLGPRVGVLFCLLPSGAMALAYGISSALQVDLGFTESQISASTTVTLLAGAVGCGLAGAIGDRIGTKRLLAAAYALTCVPTAYLGWTIADVGLEGVSFGLFLACAILYRFAFGISFGVRGAVCMSMTNPTVGATQFTGYNSLGNLSIAYSGYWQGLAVAHWGYGTTLGIDGLAGLSAILLIPWLLPSQIRAQTISPAANPKPTGTGSPNSDYPSSSATSTDHNA